MKILGINGWIDRGHDGAACIIIDGKLKYVEEEERIIRKKHAYDRAPKWSIKHALNYCHCNIDEIDKIIFGWDYPKLYKMINKEFISNKEMTKSIFNTDKYVDKFEYLDHHLAHAYSTFYPSNYDEALVFVIDGQGEYMATSVYKANRKDKKMDLVMESPISLGYFYAGITIHAGFKSGEEGKTMGLAPYGEPVYYNDLKKHINFENGKLNCSFLIKKTGKDEEKSTFDEWDNILSKIIPKNKLPIMNIDTTNKKYADLAASAERLLEDVVKSMVTKYVTETGIHNICISGGVGLNCPMSSLIENLDIVNKVFVQPAANDTGIALGCAIYGAVKYGDNVDIEMIPYLGDEFNNEQIINAINEKEYNYEYYDNIEKKIAELLTKNYIVCNYQGRTEYGPRALGNRSILISPMKKENLIKVNTLKNREIWRPLAPAVLYDKQEEIFGTNIFSPHMTKNFSVTKKWKNKIPAAVHVDGTSRVQSVTKHYNERFYNIINEFYKLTNVPVIINTSFNIRGEPIVNSPLDAINSFERMNLDYLVLGNYIISKR